MMAPWILICTPALSQDSHMSRIPASPFNTQMAHRRLRFRWDTLCCCIIYSSPPVAWGHLKSTHIGCFLPPGPTHIMPGSKMAESERDLVGVITCSIGSDRRRLRKWLSLRAHTVFKALTYLQVFRTSLRHIYWCGIKVCRLFYPIGANYWGHIAFRH